MSSQYVGYVRRSKANTWSRKGEPTPTRATAERRATGFAVGMPGWESAVVTFADGDFIPNALTAAELVALGGSIVEREERDREHVAKHAKARLQHDTKPAGPTRPGFEPSNVQIAAVSEALKAHANPRPRGGG